MYPDLDLNNTLFDFCLLVYKSKKEVADEQKRQTVVGNVRLPYKD